MNVYVYMGIDNTALECLLGQEVRNKQVKQWSGVYIYVCVKICGKHVRLYKYVKYSNKINIYLGYSVFVCLCVGGCVCGCVSAFYIHTVNVDNGDKTYNRKKKIGE